MVDEARDERFVHQAGQDGERDVARGLVRHAQPALEAGLEAEPVGPFADERPAPVHHHERPTRVVQRRDEVERRVVLTGDAAADLENHCLARPLGVGVRACASAVGIRP